MEQEAISRDLLGGLLVLFLLVRAFFTIKSRLKGGRNPKNTNVVVHEAKANFILRRFIIVPALSASIFFFYNQPTWMRMFLVPLPQWGIFLGGIFGLCGIVLLIWIHILLGKQWSAKILLRNDHQLVQSGPYSRIRHPMYAALFTIYLSVGIVSSNYAILILMTMAIVSIYLRIPKEEEVLIMRFGDEYRRYIKRTGRLLPRLRDVD
jgi:protein-S-isoprenylcysteine O-methyltransferase Ste14